MVTIINYGMGNLWSVSSAVQYLGGKPLLTDDPETILNSGFLILPGVGSFRKGMLALKDRGLDEVIIDAVRGRGANILGICLGMQLLGTYGTEGGETEGLGLINIKVEPFTIEEVGETRKIPHVGFNNVGFNDDDGLYRGLPPLADFYFTHSYRMLSYGVSGRIGLCSYGVNFLAAFECENVCGTQFHPEKSQTNGLILLRNFLSK